MKCILFPSKLFKYPGCVYMEIKNSVYSRYVPPFLNYQIMTLPKIYTAPFDLCNYYPAIWGLFRLVRLSLRVVPRAHDVRGSMLTVINIMCSNFSFSPPFTIQRLCELLSEPKKNYTKCDKFMRGVEKNLMVVSSWHNAPRYILDFTLYFYVCTTTEHCVNEVEIQN